MNFNPKKSFDVSLSKDELLIIIDSYIKDIKTTASSISNVDSVLKSTSEQVEEILKLHNKLGSDISRILELQPKYAKGGVIDNTYDLLLSQVKNDTELSTKIARDVAISSIERRKE